MIKAAADWFTDAKLEDAKSVKNNMIDQWQNSDNIIDFFDMINQLNKVLFNKTSFNKASLSKAFKLSALYQHLNCFHINTQMWYHCMCHISMYKILKLCQIAKNIDIDSMSMFKQLCKVCIQNKFHKHVSKVFWYFTFWSDKIIHINISNEEKITSFLDENNCY